MPTGARYDGRYNLPGDLADLDPTDNKAMAAHYAISPAAYRRGQEWAKMHPLQRQTKRGNSRADTR
jgi:hypothetical protein